MLVVDDEEALCRALVRNARGRSGRRAFGAGGSREAIDIVRRERVDLAVVDLVLGYESGIDLIVQLRREHPEVRCVAITGFAHAHLVQAAFRAGAHDLFVKPFTWPEVFRSVEHGPAVPRGTEALPSLSEIKREYMRGLVAMHEGNVTRAAATAGIDRTTLRRMLRGDGKRARGAQPEPVGDEEQ